MNNVDKNEELNLQIRKFLKQVGVESHQLIEKLLKSNASNCNISIKLEINNAEVKKFETNLNNN